MRKAIFKIIALFAAFAWLFIYFLNKEDINPIPIVIFVSVYSAFAAFREIAVARASTARGIQQVASMLWSPDRNAQRTAIWALSLVAGARFGKPVFLSASEHDRCCEMWRAWWTQYGNHLAWDDALSVYVIKDDEE